MYLGDGWIGAHPKEVHRLNIYLDASDLGIVESTGDPAGGATSVSRRAAVARLDAFIGPKA